MFSKITSAWQHYHRRLLWGLLSSGYGLSAGLLPLAAFAQTSPTPAPPQPSRPAVTNGVYFFGQAPEPGLIGHDYLVFELRNGQAFGAIYAPHSEYSCFTGTVEGNQLALNVIDSYDNQVYAYAIPLDHRSTLTAGQAQPPLVLAGYQAITPLRELEYQLLEACR